MNPLSLPYRRHVEAAKGWCELHAFDEANAELEQVTSECRAHPDVLEVRWLACANLEKWEAALDLANAIARSVPNEPKGTYLASSLRELGRKNEAFTSPAPSGGPVPLRRDVVLYDLACVCCLLGQVEDARAWLGKAIDVGGDELKKRALDDPDLEPVWTEQW